jgi:iron complex outermembrane receptor protein
VKATLLSTTNITSHQGDHHVTYRNPILRLATCLGICGVTAAAAPAIAQDSPSLQEIVVTAQRRSERLVDVPMSIAAMTGDDLVASGITSTGDLQQLTPGLVTPNVGLSFTPAIRGVTSVSTSPGDETNVALYLDDVYIGASTAGLFELADIERIEVLKGPQGTLFGRNATGGAIRIVTKSPSFTPEAELSAEYGYKYDRWKLSGYGTTPLSDTVAVSVAVNYVDDDGYIKGVGPNVGKRFAVEHSVNTRGKLLFKPDETLSFTLEGDYAKSSNTGIYAWDPRAANFATRNVPGVVFGGDYEYAGSTQPLADLETYGTSLSGDWQANDFLSIRSITALREAKGLYQTDSDRTSLSTAGLRLRQNQRNFSQEFILSTPADRTVSAVGGLFYYHSRAWNPYFNTYAGNPPTGTVTSSFTNNVITDSYAAYGDVTWTPVERLHLTGGARYTTEKKDIDFNFLVRAAGLVSASDDRTWSSSTFRGVIRYDLSNDANVYASVSNGFKTGVFNAYAYPLVAVSPEKITAYEVGAKAQFDEWAATVAAFDYDYRDIQVQAQTQQNGAFVVTLSNAAKSTIRGFEATLGGHLASQLRIDLGASYIPTAKYDDYTKAQVFVPTANGNLSVTPYNASGSRAIRTPKYQANVRLGYDATVARGKLDTSLSYSYNSGFYFQPGNFSRQTAYNIVNARIAWTEPSNRWTVSITGENLTNERYSFYTTDSLPGTVDVLGRPREVNVGVAAKF